MGKICGLGEKQMLRMIYGILACETLYVKAQERAFICKDAHAR